MLSPELRARVSKGSVLLYSWPGPAQKVQDLSMAQLCRALAMQLCSIRSPAQGTTAAGGRWAARNGVG